MPQQWKKAEYPQSGRSKIEAQRAEWYRVSEGFTLNNRVCLEGELFHLSELDSIGPDGSNVESFRPLTINEQERRFGRVMYMPYNPTDEELEALGYEREDVRADPTETEEQLEALRGNTAGGDDYKAQLAAMDKAALQSEAQTKWNMALPAEMPENRMRAALLKLNREGAQTNG